jgi:antitoxin component YwqK of YwqJK toxin-antitoxin module
VLRKGRYSQGVPTGEHKFVGTDGRVYGKSVILKGNGKWAEYFPDGKKKVTGSYANGHWDGK